MRLAPLSLCKAKAAAGRYGHATERYGHSTGRYVTATQAAFL